MEAFPSNVTINQNIYGNASLSISYVTRQELTAVSATEVGNVGITLQVAKTGSV
jgi:hypothetical protein